MDKFTIGKTRAAVVLTSLLENEYNYCSRSVLAALSKYNKIMNQVYISNMDCDIKEYLFLIIKNHYIRFIKGFSYPSKLESYILNIILTNYKLATRDDNERNDFTKLRKGSKVGKYQIENLKD